MTEPRYQPELLARIAEVAGQTAADLIAAEWGGRRLYIPLPETIDDKHRLAQVLGTAHAQAIAAALGRGEVLIPMGESAGPRKRRRAVAAMLANRVPQAEAAKRAGVHTRTVERVAARKKSDEQDSLF